MKKILIALSVLVLAVFLNTSPVNAQEDPSCGHTYPPGDPKLASCACASGQNAYTTVTGLDHVCCGWVTSITVGGKVFDACTGTPNVVIPGPDITKGLTSGTFDSLNPLKISGSGAAADLSTPGGIISRLLSFLFPLAGLVLFLLISWGGFEILLNSASQKGVEAGKNRITAAIVGFILLFSAYWMAQIVEVVFGIQIL